MRKLVYSQDWRAKLCQTFEIFGSEPGALPGLFSRNIIIKALSEISFVGFIRFSRFRAREAIIINDFNMRSVIGMKSQQSQQNSFNSEYNRNL